MLTNRQEIFLRLLEALPAMAKSHPDESPSDILDFISSDLCTYLGVPEKTSSYFGDLLEYVCNDCPLEQIPTSEKHKYDY